MDNTSLICHHLSSINTLKANITMINTFIIVLELKKKTNYIVFLGDGNKIDCEKILKQFLISLAI